MYRISTCLSLDILNHADYGFSVLGLYLENLGMNQLTITGFGFSLGGQTKTMTVSNAYFLCVIFQYNNVATLLKIC